MSRILVTGGTGVLGRELVNLLGQAGHTPRIMSRKSQPADLGTGLEWAQADMMTGQGLTAAVKGIDVIIHAASNARSNTQQTDVEGTERLVKAANAAKVAHLIYISIVGIDRVPYSYYKSKLAAEQIIQAGNVAWSILRATQFHDLIDLFLRMMIRFPIALVPTGTIFQAVDTGEVAAELVRVAGCPPAGFLPDMGGPEVLTMGQMAKDWLAVRHQRALIIPIRAPGGFAHAMRHGYNTCPENRQGKITWKQWLHSKYVQRGINNAHSK